MGLYGGPYGDFDGFIGVFDLCLRFRVWGARERISMRPLCAGSTFVWVKACLKPLTPNPKP